ESLQFGDCHVDGLGIQMARGMHAATEPRQHLLVEEDGRRARNAFIDDEANRVRADIDDRNRFPAGQPALRAAVHQPADGFLARLRCEIRFGGWIFSASPRPDRLGLVMKYSWALKRSSPSSGWMRREVPSGNTSKL